MAVSKIKQDKKKCSMCSKEKVNGQFYMSYSQMDSDGRVRTCKECLKTKFDVNDLESIKDMLRMIDKPLNINLWKSANTKNDVIGEYFKLINAKDFRNHTWKDSDFEQKFIKTENIKPEIPINEDYDLEELKELYGYGYPDDQYYLFEKKFLKLKPSFQLPTPMHEEYLREYCVNKVKETLAKAEGDFKQAKEWANMAKDSADAGKLKPSQMSKADLSQGLDTFGQMARMVEEHDDIIAILPKFAERPKDNVDVTLWLYINYIRDLQGLPEATYQDIYKFYEDRVKEYSSTALDNLEGE